MKRSTIALNEETGVKKPCFHYVYFIIEGTAAEKGGLVKIGVAKDVKKRIRTLQTGNPRHLTIAKTYMLMGANHAYGAERNFKKKFKDDQILGEWFYINDEIMGMING